VYDNGEPEVANFTICVSGGLGGTVKVTAFELSVNVGSGAITVKATVMATGAGTPGTATEMVAA
jgi:hypothetical protein